MLIRRPVNGHLDFYALWADGNTLGLLESQLYFTGRDGTSVWRLPADMIGDFAKPGGRIESALSAPDRRIPACSQPGSFEFIQHQSRDFAIPNFLQRIPTATDLG